MTDFAHLPLEIVTLIGELLDTKDVNSCTYLNKHFYKVLNPILWHTVDIVNEDFFTRFVVSLLSSPHPSVGQHVRVVDISVAITDAQLLLFTHHLPLLKKLKLHNAPGITDTGILRLGQQCPQLKTLYLNFSDRITAQCIDTIGKYYKHLSSFLLADCPGVSPRGRTFSALKATPLRQLFLDLSMLADLNSSSVANDDVAVADLLSDLVELPCLTQLYLDHCPDNFSQLLFSKAALGPVWPHLQHFSIRNVFYVDEDAVVAFLKSHPHLTLLMLADSQLTDTTLGAIATCLPRLERLHISDNSKMTARGVRNMILHGCPNLVSVFLDNCRVKFSAFPEANPRSVRYYIRTPDPDVEDDWLNFHYDGSSKGYLTGLSKDEIAHIRQNPGTDAQQEQ